ncbi:hypothetical protein ACFLRP_05510 [Bacteroidota bacterium]
MMQLESEDEKRTIWRYMDFAKFVSLLDKSALYFARADKLGDPFEGSHGKAYVDEMKSAFRDGEEANKAFSKLSSVYKKIVKFTFISCWHLNEHESDAMWKLYLGNNKGIAIQSTVNSLKNSIKDKGNDIYIGKVKYIDYETEVMNGGLDEGERYPFYHKRKSFEHEQELRLAIQHFKSIKSGGIIGARPPRYKGIPVLVDLNLLIRRIYLAPTSPEWLFELVKSLTIRFELDNTEVLPSALTTKRILY